MVFTSIVLGTDGWIAGLVCAFPTETVAMYELIKALRINEDWKFHRWFMPLFELNIVLVLVQNM